MEPLDIAGSVASIVTAATAIIGVYFVSRRFKQSERSLRFNACYQTMEMLEKTRDARHLLESKVPEHPGDRSLSGFAQSSGYNARAG